MLTCEQRQEPPNLLIKMAGVITLGEMTSTGPAIEAVLARTSPGAVFFIDNAAFDGFEPEAAGVAFYLAQKVFEANPRLILVVNGGRVHHTALFHFAERLDTDGKLRFFGTEADAMDFLARE